MANAGIAGGIAKCVAQNRIKGRARAMILLFVTGQDQAGTVIRTITGNFYRLAIQAHFQAGNIAHMESKW